MRRIHTFFAQKIWFSPLKKISATEGFYALPRVQIVVPTSSKSQRIHILTTPEGPFFRSKRTAGSSTALASSRPFFLIPDHADTKKPAPIGTGFCSRK